MPRWAQTGQVDRVGCRFTVELSSDRKELLEPVDRDLAQPLSVRALIDTGAQASVISEKIAGLLQCPVIHYARLTGAVSNARVPLVAAIIFLPSRDEIGRSGSKVQLLVGKLQDADLLFGMDLLRGGRFELDGVKEIWSWKLEQSPWPVPARWI
jgi:hypothetical protein